MDEIIRTITEGQVGGSPQTLIYADDIIIYELIQITLDVKFHMILAVCKDSGLNINLDKCMVMKYGGGKETEKVKCNNHEIWRLKNFN
jgi:hypothetical protein